MMDQANQRKCPACGSADYRFRGRKKMAAESGEGAVTETKYRCQPCEHEWKERSSAEKHK